MDARERYDPEDLEALLSERAFDELLAEERAFVLRHVADRAEYETLRATLAQVRAHGRPGPLVAADPEVRDRVLTAFREARRPAWRIWLNTVGTWLAPPSPAQYWRPALAFGTLALLIAVGVAVWMPGPGLEQDGLAELKPMVLQDKTTAAAKEESATEAPRPTVGDQAEADRETTANIEVTEPSLAAPPAAGLTSAALAEVPTSADDAVATEAEMNVAEPREDLAFTRDAAAAPASTTLTPHYETLGDEQREVSVAEVASTGKTRRKASAMDGEASASLAGSNADLRSLMRAAW